MSNKTASGLIAYAKAQLGRPYCMGTFGQTASAWLYKSNKARLPAYYTAQDFSRQYGQRVHDCVGLIKGYLWSDGPNSAPKYLAAPCGIDHSADSMYGVCSPHGQIHCMPDMPGCLVFIYSAKTGRMEHVGVNIGGGQVIEARGHAYGVVQTALNSRGWTHWGLCPYITYDAAAAAETEDDDMLDISKLTDAQVLALGDRYAALLAERPTYSEAAAAMARAKAAGIMDGKRPCSVVTRGELAITMDRAELLKAKK